jgi:hypothetical protein
MKKLLTVLFAALMSTSMLMAQGTAPEKDTTKPAKTKTTKTKTTKTKTTKEKAPKTTEEKK